MKKTIYKGISWGAIAMCLILIVGCIVPLSTFAAAAPNAEQDSIHFINPTAITVLGDYLYVADTVENGKSALLCFKINGNASVSLAYTYEMNGVISGLSNDGDSTIYAIMGKSVAEVSAKNGVATLTDVVYEGFENNVVDFVKGNYNGNATLFALTNNLLRRNNTTGVFGNATNDNWTDTKGCLALDDVVFFVYKSAANTSYYCGGYTSEGYLLSNPLKITEPIGIVEFNGNVAFFSQHSISYVNDISMGYWTNNQDFQGNALETLISDTGDKTIADVAIKNNNEDDAIIFVLNEGINKIDVYTKQANAYVVTDTIGSDIVSKTVPTSYTSYTLVRPTGYPTNIVYKTKENNSISDIITNASEYIILGYEGEESSHYYYVMVGDKFGWVKKSDGAASCKTDSKLRVINNNLGTDEVGYTTKLVSLKATYVYDLPLSGASNHAVTQSASNMADVKVLQEFTEGDQVWYLVEFGENETGFVKKEDVGAFRNVPKSDDLHIEGLRKINSTLFSAVDVYLTAELNELAVDCNGDPIKLYSGDPVDLIRIEGDSAFISIRHGGTDEENYEREYGWIPANRLIEKGQITTNAIVGLSLLGFAIVLAGVLIFVYFRRKKKIKANND